MSRICGKKELIKMKKLLIVVGFSFVNCLLPMEGEGMPLKNKRPNDTVIELTLLGKSKTHGNKQKRLVRCDDWPFLPYQNIKQGLKRLPKTSYGVICECSSKKRLLCAVGTLPKEITRHIICKMLDEDTLATDQFMAMPLVCAFQRFHHVKEKLTEHSQFNDKSVGLFFRMTEQQEQALGLLVRPSIKAQLFFDDIALTDQDLKQLNDLDEDIWDEFLAGQEIVVLDPEANARVECSFPAREKKVFLLGGGLILIVESGIGGFLYGLGAMDLQTAGIVVGGATGAGVVLLGVMFCSIFIDSLRRTAQRVTL